MSRKEGVKEDRRNSRVGVKLETANEASRGKKGRVREGRERRDKKDGCRDERIDGEEGREGGGMHRGMNDKMG